MSWPLPLPEDIAARAAAEIEARFPAIDARSPHTAGGVLARTIAQATYEVWLYQRRLAEELMPDTASDWLERHAAVWGLARLAASAATGSVRFSGAPGTVLPAGIALRGASGARYTTAAGGTIGVGGVLDLTVLADAAGAAGNAAAAATLDLVSPIAGLSPQAATAVEGGLAGGADAEEDEALRARLLARIRRPPHGGAAFDYEAWTRAASPEVAQVAVHPAWVGPGSVGVVVGMRGPRAPTGAELELVAAAIEARRPVTAQVTVLAAVPLPVDVTLVLDPDTVPIRAAVQAAVAAFFGRDGGIGARLPRSRLSEAISSAAGEYSHQLLAPAADVSPAATEMPVLGALTFESPDP